MLLVGAYPRSLDDKLRLAIPRPLRAACGEPGQGVLYAAPTTDGALALYPPAAFAALAEEIARRPSAEADVRAFSRLFFAQAQAAELDGQGRVRLPAELARAAGLEREVMLLGVRDHLEVWNQLRWDAYLAAAQPEYDRLAERVLGGASAPSASSTPAVLSPAPILPR